RGPGGLPGRTLRNPPGTPAPWQMIIAAADQDRRAAAGRAPAASPHAQAGAVTDSKSGLNAVSVLSSSGAWAVGDSATAVHWNGTSWAPVTIPGLPVGVFLYAVDALSPSDVWAAGEAGAPGAHVTALIVHWDGTAWETGTEPGPVRFSNDRAAELPEPGLRR